MRLSFALLSLSLVAGCGDDDTPAVMPMTDGGMFCSSASDCDDGLFCNGAEYCEPSDPGANALGCVAGNDPCAEGLVCDDVDDTCRIESCEDADGDGATDMACGGTDCDDSDPDRYPGATEICDPEGVDEDCDLTTFGSLDADDDGAVAATCCNGDRCGSDCDDSDPETYPDATEICDDVDNDCDGESDERLIRELYYPDEDMDGYGDAEGEPVMACRRPEGRAANDTDCDDSLATVSPVSPELCDGEDNDCDGDTDEVEENTFWEDVDDDGWGDTSRPMTVDGCEPPEGYSARQGDCAPADPDIHPMAAERCNRIDDDCSLPDDPGGVDVAEDVDDDGHSPLDGACEGGPLPEDDCDDDNPLAYTGATEFCSGFDGDCDGGVDEADVVAACAPDQVCDGGCVAGEDLSLYATNGCVIEDGAVLCWGAITADETARPGEGGVVAATTPYSVPAPVARGVDSAIQVALGGWHACALLEDRTVRCWGENYFGQLGIGDTELSTAIETPAISDVVELAIGDLANLARTANGEVYFWGLDFMSVDWLAFTDAMPVTSPRRVTGLPPVVEIEIGRATACARTLEGEVWCWGWWPTGDGTMLDNHTPTRIPELDGALALDSRRRVFCARFADRHECWGHADGLLTDEPVLAPVPLDAAGTAVDLGFGDRHGCAVRSDGSVDCWGRPIAGVLGTSRSSSLTSEQIDTPVGIEGIDDASLVSCARQLCCARRDAGVSCWGDPREPTHGDGSDRRGVDPIPTVLPTDLVELDLGTGHGVAVTEGGELLTWGRNDQGQLGLGDQVDRLIPEEVALADVVEVAAHEHRTCVRTSAGAVYCMGDGAPGDGTTPPPTATVSPTLVDASSMGAASAIAVAREGSCALDASGGAWCWGAGRVCGDGTLSTASYCAAPVRVAGVPSFSAIAAGRDHVCAIVSGTGGVWCWGGGFLGDGGVSGSPVPVEVQDETGALELALGARFTCARRATDVVCWGEEDDGRLGSGEEDRLVATPVEIEGAMTPLGVTENIECRRDTCFARLADGSWVGWGANRGRLGDGTTEFETSRAAPAAHGVAWARLRLGEYSVCGERDDGTWECWASLEGETLWMQRAWPIRSDVAFP